MFERIPAGLQIRTITIIKKVCLRLKLERIFYVQFDQCLWVHFVNSAFSTSLNKLPKAIQAHEINIVS